MCVSFQLRENIPGSLIAGQLLSLLLCLYDHNVSWSNPLRLCPQTQQNNYVAAICGPKNKFQQISQ